MNKKHNIKHFFSGILLFLLLACPPAFAKKQQMGYGVEKPVKQILLQIHAPDGTYRYEYTLTDHLGSVRAVFTEDGSDADNQPDILASRAYMPGGMLMPGTLDETGVHYRFGYQGQFAEEDDETGYNQFMARLYDPRIGHWLIPDAAKQYWNPYLAMGNNWMNVFDRDGLFDSWLSALWYKIWKGGEISYSEDRGEWYVSERIEEPLRAEGAIVHYKRNFEWYKGSWTDASFGDWFLSGGRVIDGPYFGGTAPCPGFGRGTGFLRAANTGTQFTKSSLKIGNQMHKGYKVSLHNPAKGLYKEFTGVKGIRPDFVDMNKRIIHELKPYNPRQISAGWKQLNNYKTIFEQQYGGTWKTVLDLY